MALDQGPPPEFRFSSVRRGSASSETPGPPTPLPDIFFLRPKSSSPILFFFRRKSSENRQVFFENMKIPVFVDPLKEPDPETMTMLKSSRTYADSFTDFIFRPNGALVMPLPSFDLLSSDTRTPPAAYFFSPSPSESHGVTPWLRPPLAFFFSSVRRN